MIRMTLGEVADCIDAQLVGVDPDTCAEGVVTSDSRAVVAGGLFAAIEGERVDGHDYVASATAAGVVASIVTRAVPEPHLLVADTVQALTALATHATRRAIAESQLNVLGITGSVGKTSTKDLLGHVLSASGPTVAPQGSFNNELGVPLTALKVDSDTRFLVSEMGARGIGHIDHLCRIVHPQVGIVLNVGAAHAGEFGGREFTARAKGELVAALPADGVAILNGDDEWVRSMAERTEATVLTFGRGEQCDVRAVNVCLDDLARATFEVQFNDAAATVLAHGASFEVSLAISGEHQVHNALAVLTAALLVGVSADTIVRQLNSAAPSALRMNIVRTPSGVTVIDDSYNANPDSVRAGLDALRVIGKSARTWAVLGEMLELGDTSTQDHAEIGAYAVQQGIDVIVAVGEGAVAIAQGARAAIEADGSSLRPSTGGGGAAAARTVSVSDRAAAWDLLSNELACEDVVLIKASRSIGLDVLASQLLSEVGGRRPE